MIDFIKNVVFCVVAAAAFTAVCYAGYVIFLVAYYVGAI